MDTCVVDDSGSSPCSTSYTKSKIKKETKILVVQSVLDLQ